MIKQFLIKLRSKVRFLLKHRDLNLCSQCPEHTRGLCCYTSHVIEDSGKQYNIILDKHPCKYLDLTTKLCSVFTTRFKVNPQCMQINAAIKGNALPVECIYIRKNNKYKNGLPKRLMSEVFPSLKELKFLRIRKDGTKEYTNLDWHLENESARRNTMNPNITNPKE